MSTHSTGEADGISGLIARGKFRQVVKIFQSGQSLTVEELHDVFVAYVELKAPAYQLAIAYHEASKKAGFEELYADFWRDWALHALEVEGNLVIARERINYTREVEDTDLQRVLGRLADGKITLKEGHKEEAFELIKEGRTMAHTLEMPAQVTQNCDWWYTVLLSELGKDDEAVTSARAAIGAEKKLLRLMAYLLLAWVPAIGPSLARQVFKRY